MIRIDNVSIPEATATHLIPYKLNVTAPTPAAPTVFAMVLSDKIAASGRLIFFLSFSNTLPELWFSLIRTPICERVKDSNTDSNREQRNDIPKARKKYNKRVVIEIEFMLYLLQSAISNDGNMVTMANRSIP